MQSLARNYQRDERVWDACASTYEKQIVCGHPDILAFEHFEEDFLDRVLLHLSRAQDRPIRLMDIGCGSGRLHLRYGAKAHHRAHASQPSIHDNLDEVWGLDFSANMIALAQRKIEDAGLHGLAKPRLSLEKGSAFELAPSDPGRLPVAICLVNSIGVMQGPEGAEALFASMRKAVEPAGGIAIISNYQREYLPAYGLGQYESTLDVSGQPAWMVPDTYASGEYLQIARAYKTAHSQDPTLVVDVYDQKGQLVKAGHVLERDPARTSETLETGSIRTCSDYQSHWYSFDQMENWRTKHWPDHAFHFETRCLDGIRAEPAQMTVLDCGHHLDSLFCRWKLA